MYKYSRYLTIVVCTYSKMNLPHQYLNFSVSVWISRYLNACRYLCVYIDIYFIHKGQVPKWSPQYSTQMKALYVDMASMCQFSASKGLSWEEMANEQEKVQENKKAMLTQRPSPSEASEAVKQNEALELV